MSSAPNPPVCRSGDSITRTALVNVSHSAGATSDAPVRSSTNRATWQSSGRRGMRNTTINTAATEAAVATAIRATSRQPVGDTSHAATAAATIGTAAADAARATAPSAASTNHRRLMRASSARSSSWSASFAHAVP